MKESSEKDQRYGRGGHSGGKRMGVDCKKKEEGRGYRNSKETRVGKKGGVTQCPGAQ